MPPKKKGGKQSKEDDKKAADAAAAAAASDAAAAEKEKEIRRQRAQAASVRTVKDLNDLIASLPRPMVDAAADKFYKSDTDQSGAIERSELAALFRSLGMSLTEEAFDRYVTKSSVLADVDHDGLISKDEFIGLYCQVVAPNVKYGERLRKAAARRETDTVRDLIARGCHPGFADAGGYTAVHYASQCGHLACLKEIESALGEDCDWDAPDKTGWTALGVAAHSGHIEIVRFLLNNGADPASVDATGRNTLHHAAAGGSHAVLQELLADEDGLEVAGSADNSGWTPLHVAAIHGHPECIKVLLDAPDGANINILAEDRLG